MLRIFSCPIETEKVAQRFLQVFDVCGRPLKVALEPSAREHLHHEAALAVLADMLEKALHLLLQADEEWKGRFESGSVDTSRNHQQPVLHGGRPEHHSLHILVVVLCSNKHGHHGVRVSHGTQNQVS